ncbi:MAG TPA: ATP-binding protein [Bryobacteraceae bacterium]|nr:ATP-binding protein [Bryobacteraceae bacterium]
MTNLYFTGPPAITANEHEPQLRELLSALFHDLREPLRTIQVSIELLQKRADRIEDPALWLSRAAQNTTRIFKLMHDFEVMAWASNSAPEGDVEMSEVLEAAKGALGASIQASRAVIAAPALPRVRGNGVALSRVFQNLLSNAIKYRREERPDIQVNCRKSGLDWVFSVTDNGIGINASDRTRIFAAFKRLHPQATFEGSGLGLTICRRIVELHGGHIWLRSSSSRGSTFCFTLPRAEARPAGRSNGSKKRPAEASRAATVQSHRASAAAA